MEDLEIHREKKKVEGQTERQKTYKVKGEEKEGKKKQLE